MYKVWVYLEYDHVSFKTAKTAMVCVEGNYELLTDYRRVAVSKLYKHVGMQEGKHYLVIHDWKVYETENMEIIY